MTTNYPGALDDGTTLPSSYSDGTATDVEHAEKHNNLSDAIIAIETELGVEPSGLFSTVVARLASKIALVPTASQTVQPTGDFTPLILQAHATQSVAMFQIKSSAGAVLGSITEVGAVDAIGYRLGGSTLASTHLSDTANILKNPSPSITGTPSISDPAMSGTAVAPTPSTADDSTKVATTAHVIAQALAKLASPALTGTPVAPTAAVDTNTTQVATTEFVINQIEDTPAVPPVTGMILAYAGASAPSGWLLCDGTAVSQATYADLYTAIGVAYGNPGGGNFNLPDLRGRIPWGKGTHVDVDTLGESDGVAVGTRRPKHAHTTSLSSGAASSHSHGGGSSGSGGSHSHSHGTATGGNANGGSGSHGEPSGVSTSDTGSHSHSFQTSYDGSHTHGFSGNVGSTTMIEPPYYVLNYIIKT